jgi:HAD superfamily hydrolase (TIGR01459 family)
MRLGLLWLEKMGARAGERFMTQVLLAPANISNLAAIEALYDGFIIDLWGVLHDGEAAYPGVIPCLQALKRAGKKICLLSNAPRRAKAAAAKLASVGIGEELYDALITSGEATRAALLHPPDAWHAKLGPACYQIGPLRDYDVLDGLPTYQRVESPAQADFVLNTGIEDFSQTLADYQAILMACRQQSLPMLCANPDLTVMVGLQEVICAGLLAQYYAQELEGEVRYHGKPHAPIYALCRQVLEGIAPSRILAIGDSLHTDISGANEAGLDSLWIGGGIHAKALGLAGQIGADGQVPMPDAGVIVEVIAAGRACPQWFMPRLAW